MHIFAFLSDLQGHQIADNGGGAPLLQSADDFIGTGDFFVQFEAFSSAWPVSRNMWTAASDVLEIRSTGALRLRIRNNANNAFVDTSLTPTPTFTLNKWVTILITCDRDGLCSVYEDGVLKASGDMSGAASEVIGTDISGGVFINGGSTTLGIPGRVRNVVTGPGLTPPSPAKTYTSGAYYRPFAVKIGTEIGVYDIWGQSNAAGRALLSETSDYTGIAATQNQYMLNSTPTTIELWRQGVTHWYGGDAGAGEFGCDAEIVLQAHGDSQRAYIAKQAAGGTSLYTDWSPYGAGGAQYAAALVRCRAARTVAINRGYVPVSKGLVWIQGERDAKDDLGGGPDTYYAQYLVDLIAGYRAAFGASNPVVLVLPKAGPTAAATYPAMSEVHAAINSAAATAGNCTVIDTSSDVTYPMMADDIHFNHVAQKAIGAAAYAALNP